MAAAAAEDLYFFSFLFSQRPACGRQAQRRKGIVVWLVWLSAAADWLGGYAALQPGPQNCGAPYFFLLPKPTPEAEQLFRRIVFNVIARNCDDHTKNFTFRLKQNSHWELAPAYDLCYAYKPEHLWVSQHALSVNGKRKEITKSDLLVVGKSITCKHAAAIVDDIEATVMNWPTFANETDVSEKLSAAIYSTIRNWN